MSPSTITLKTFANKLESKLEKAKSKMHKSKTSDKTNKAIIKADQNNHGVINPAQNNKEGHHTTVEPEQSGVEGQEVSQPTSCTTMKKQDKAAKRAVRRQARKEKWTARCAAFKTKAKKVSNVLLLSTAAVGGIILAPVILVVDIVFFVLNTVLELVIRILDLIFCGPILVCFICK